MKPSEYLRLPQNQAHLRVLQVLRRWDPIGVISEANQNEYDSYSARIVDMLDTGATIEELTDHLRWIVTERMEIVFDEAHSRDCAEELVRYWPL